MKEARATRKRQQKIEKQHEIMKTSKNKLEILTEQLQAAERALGKETPVGQVNSVVNFETKELLP